MPGDSDLPLIDHLTALRRVLLRSLAAIALLFLPALYASPVLIQKLVAWCVPQSMGPLHYFAPMEAFLVELEFALVLSLIASFPWSAWQLWSFLVPALNPAEKRNIGRGVLISSALFLLGAAFCVGFILPLMMRFSAGFASDAMVPTLGIASFLHLSGGIILAFGFMFQLPLLVLLAVRLDLLPVGKIHHARPYVWTLILILSALLTPPDIVSQCMLAIPTGLLFEIGLLVAGRIRPAKEEPSNP